VDKYKRLDSPPQQLLKLNMRNVLAATIIAGLLIIFVCTSDSSFATSIRTMASDPQQEARDPHVSQSHLILELKESDKKTSPPTVIATVTNMHESTTITLLKWDTPFDDQAMLLGIFELKNTEDGSILPPAGIKLNRQLPPPEDAFLEIPPRQAVAKEIVLGGPGARLRKGRKYEVKAMGSWKAVWQASVVDVGYQNLQRMGGGTGVVSFEFESNSVTFEA
jgi:hypothetical protein